MYRADELDSLSEVLFPQNRAQFQLIKQALTAAYRPLLLHCVVISYQIYWAACG